MIYFIVNEKSRTGKGKAVWEEVQQILKREAVEYQAWITEYKGHATDAAREICSLPEEEITLAVVGGDGTVNEVINGITDFEKVRLGVIPTGSGNDYARGLGMKGTTEDFVSRILNHTQDETIDLGRVWWNGCEKPRYFAISAGIGLDAIVCKKALSSKLKEMLNKVHLGSLTYVLLTIQTLFSMETAEVKAVFDRRKKGRFRKLIFAAAMNFTAEGGGVPMAPKADSADGQLSMCLAHGIPKWLTFLFLPLLVMGKHERLRGFCTINFKRCDLHVDKPMVLHADGEFCGMVTDVRYECVEERLHIIR